MIMTAYVLSQTGYLMEIGLSQDDHENGPVSIEDHIDFVTDHMIEGDELINIVIH